MSGVYVREEIMTDKSHEVYDNTMALARHHRSPEVTRRRLLQVSAGAAALAATWDPGEVRADMQGAIVVYQPSGQRLDGVARAILPFYEKKFPNIDVSFASIPLGDYVNKQISLLGSKVDRFDAMCGDHSQFPAYGKMQALADLQPYLDQDPDWYTAYKADISEKYRYMYYTQKPGVEYDGFEYREPATAGQVSAIPSDGNVNLTYYRKDLFEQKGMKLPEHWDQVIDVVKELHDPDRGVYGYAASMKRDFWAGFQFYAALTAHGGDWFDKAGSGGWNPAFDTDAGHLALEHIVALQPYAHPVTANAGEDELNVAYANGSAVYGPTTWGAATLNDPNFTEFYDRWYMDLAPRGNNPEGGNHPLTGGWGYFMPTHAKYKDLGWTWIRFVNTGDDEDSSIPDARVLAGGQPARISTLERYRAEKPFFNGLLNCYPHAIPLSPPIPEAHTCLKITGEEAADAFNGVQSVDDALKAMDKRVQRLMEDGGYYG
jgi:ABC-type glycerol-3-phosphate transport system substrate-binding protein